MSAMIIERKQSSSTCVAQSVGLILNRHSVATHNEPYDAKYNNGIPRPYQLMPSICDIDEVLQGNVDFVCASRRVNSFQKWPEKLLHRASLDKDFLMELFDKIERADFRILMGHINGAFCDDKEVMLKAVARYGSCLRYVSERLLYDADVVSVAVNNDGYALKFVPKKMYEHAGRYDIGLVNLAIDNYPLILREIGEQYCANRELMMRAVGVNGSVLRYASEELRADREVVLRAVETSTTAFEYASVELRADREVAMRAIAKCGVLLWHASTELRCDRELICLAMTTSSSYNNNVLFNDDYDVMSAVVSSRGKKLYSASKRLRADKNIVMLAVANDYYAIIHASKELRVDRDVARVALAQSMSMMEYVGAEL